MIIQAGKKPGEMDFMSVLHWNNWRRGAREEGGEEEEENGRGREGRGGGGWRKNHGDGRRNQGDGRKSGTH